MSENDRDLKDPELFQLGCADCVVHTKTTIHEWSPERLTSPLLCHKSEECTAVLSPVTFHLSKDSERSWKSSLRPHRAEHLRGTLKAEEHCTEEKENNFVPLNSVSLLATCHLGDCVLWKVEGYGLCLGKIQVCLQHRSSSS